MKKMVRTLWKSKTMIFAQLLAFFGVLQAHQDPLAALLEDPSHRTVFIVLVAVVVAGLRTVTKEPISAKAEDK